MQILTNSSGRVLGSLSWTCGFVPTPRWPSDDEIISRALEIERAGDPGRALAYLNAHIDFADVSTIQ